MKEPKILSEVIHDLGHDVTAGWDHLAHHHPTAPTSQESTMAATLHEAIHQTILDAVDTAVADILGRYLTLPNLVNAAADALNGAPQPPAPPAASPALPPLPEPAPADAPDAPDSAT